MKSPIILRPRAARGRSFRSLVGAACALSIGVGGCELALDAEPLDEVDEPTALVEIEEAAYSYLGPVGVTLATGQSKVYPVTVGAGDVLVAQVVPASEVGNANLAVFDRDPSAAFAVPVLLAQSSRAAGYVDGVFLPRPVGATTTYYAKVICASGPCSFTVHVGAGDRTTFRMGSTYLNQRSFLSASGKCKSSGGATLRDGDCMCAPASAASRLVLDGKRKVSELRTVAEDLFKTNLWGGAADRTALMNRLVRSYGYNRCAETSYESGAMLETLKTELRAGAFVLFRSKRLTSAGHYVVARGFQTVNGRSHVFVDDPFGAWLSLDRYSLNGDSPSSAVGQSRSYDYLNASGPGSSVIVCK